MTGRKYMVVKQWRHFNYRIVLKRNLPESTARQLAGTYGRSKNWYVYIAPQ